jgi:uncharacterized membrane protein YphA (DoxX/SURF4 family)
MKANSPETRRANSAIRSILPRVPEMVLGLIFLVSSVAHLNNPFAFLNSVLNYQIVSGWPANVIAISLPALEFVIGVCLVSGSLRFGALGTAALMLAGFTLAQLSALFRGLAIDCGCFGSASQMVSIQSVAFVSVLLVTATFLFFMTGIHLMLERKLQRGLPDSNLLT